MSTHRKVDPDAGARFLMDLLAEDEAERLDRLSDEEYLAERKAKGLETPPAPAVKELLAKLQARADRKAAATPSANGEGAPIDSTSPSGPRIAPAADASAPVERLGAPRARRLVWLLAAAIVVGIFVAVAKGPAIVAILRGDHGHEDIRPEPPLPPREVAGTLRHDAEGLCAQGAWAGCNDKLDEAKRLDPAGESDPEVQRLRKNIDSAQRPHEEPNKVPPAP